MLIARRFCLRSDAWPEARAPLIRGYTGRGRLWFGDKTPGDLPPKFRAKVLAEAQPV